MRATAHFDDVVTHTGGRRLKRLPFLFALLSAFLITLFLSFLFNPASAAAAETETTVVAADTSSDGITTGNTTETSGLAPQFSLPKYSDTTPTDPPEASADDLYGTEVTGGKGESISSTDATVADSGELVLNSEKQSSISEQQSLTLATGTTSSSSTSSTYYIDPNDPADLEASVHSPDPVFPDTNFTYTLYVTNHGPDLAINVVLDFTLDAGTSFVAAKFGNVNSAPNTYTSCASEDCSLGNMADDETYLILITVKVIAAQGSAVTGSASVSSSIPDPDSSNNSDSDSATVAYPLDYVTWADGTPVSDPRNDENPDEADITTNDAAPAPDGGYSVYMGAGELDLDNNGTAERYFTVSFVLDADPRTATNQKPLASTHWLVLIYDEFASDPDTSTGTIDFDPPLLSIGIDGKETNNDDFMYVHYQTICAIPGSCTDYEEELVQPDGTISDFWDVSVDTTSHPGDTDNYRLTFTVPFSYLEAVGIDPDQKLKLFYGTSQNNNNINKDYTNLTAKPEPIFYVDIAVEKTDGDISVEPGETYSYTITVTNLGNQDAEDVTVTDTIPDYTTFVSASDGGSESVPGTVTWTIDLAAGQSKDLTITVQVDDTVPADLEEITNSATASHPEDENPDNDTGTDTTPIDAAPILSITKELEDYNDKDSSGNVSPGDDLIYRITVTNSGNQEALGIVVTETLPNNTHGFTGAGWVLMGSGDYQWTIASLAGGASAQASFTVTIDDPLPAGAESIENCASIEGDESCANVAVIAAPDIAVTKTDLGYSFAPGNAYDYFIEVTNIGDQDANGVTVTDTLPAYLGFVGASDLGSYNAGTHTVTWIIDLAAGETKNLAVTVRVDPTIPAGLEEIINTVTVSHPDDENPGNDTGTDTTPINAAPDIAVTKSDDDYEAEPGDTYSYVINVFNFGSQGATGVIVTDTLPAYLGFVGASDLGSYNSGTNTVTWTLDLAAGESEMLILTVYVAASVPAGLEEVMNIATSSHPEDNNGGNNNGIAITPIIAAPDINVTKTDGGISVIPGQTYSYTITVTNEGNQGATNVVVIDTLPANTSFVSASDSGGHSSGVVMWIINLAAGESKDLTVTVQVDATVPAGLEELTNIADVYHPLDSDHSNDTGIDYTPVTAAPDIAVAKTDGGEIAVPDTGYGYMITVTNLGNQGAAGITVTDTLPAFVIFTGASDSGSFNAGTNTVTWTIDLDAGESKDLFVNVYVPATVPAGLEEVINSVTVSHLQDGNPGNNTATETTPIDAAPDITVTKTDGGISVVPGQTYSYTVTVTNQGNQGATGITVTDTLPAYLSFVSASDSGSYSAGTVTWTIDLIAGQTINLTVSVQVAATVPAGLEEVINSATASHPEDENPGNNTGTDYTPIIAAPDTTVTKTDGGISVVPGQTYSYTITVTNQGNQGATGVFVIDVVPAYTSFVSASDGGFFDAGDVIWSINLAAGESKELTITVQVVATVPPGREETHNVATASHPEDSNTANNTGYDTTPIIAAPDISVTKTDGGISVVPGQTYSYTITITNNGNQGAEGVTVTDTLPPYTTFVGADIGYGYDSGAGTVTWTIDLPAGMSTTRTVTVKVADTVPAGLEEITNSVTASHPEDGNPGNNTATDTTPINAAPDISVFKTDTGYMAEPGDAYGYIIMVTNNGNQDATGVTVTDTLPPYTTFVDCSDSCSYDSGSHTVTWTIALVAGETDNLVVNVRVDSTVPAGLEEVINSVTVTHPEDENPGNNTATDTTPIIAAPELSVTKTDNDGSISPGNEITYYITVENYGNQGATNVEILEAIPDYSTFVGPVGPQGWTYVGGLYSYKIGDLAAGANATVAFTIRLDSLLPAGVEEIINKTAVFDDGYNGFESTTEDNTDQEDTPVIANPDLVVTKTDNQTSVLPGQTLTYEIRVRNVGNQGATGVELVEKQPQYTTFIGPVTPDGWFYNSMLHEYTFKIGSLAAGAEVTVTFIVKVDDSLPLGVTDLINLVTVSDDGENGADMNLDDNWAEDEDRAEVTPPPVSPPLVSYPQPAPTLTPRALPYTGFDSMLLLLVSLALLSTGIITVFLSPMPAAVFRRKR